MKQWRAILSLGAVSALVGCGVGPAAVGVSGSAGSVGLAGTVHGGQTPVTGSTIQLYALGTTGYGSAMTPVGAAVMTDATGSFALGTYTCPSTTSPMLLMATSGNAGSGTNAALAEVAMLGPCGALTSATFISISEVTTAATAYALAQFAAVSGTSTGFGSTAGNVLGMTNAYGPYTNLVNNATGNARVPVAVTGLVLPQAEMNTLGNILAGCVNSNGSTVATTACAMLFAAATPAGGTAPVNTLQAAVDVALNPANNVTTLYNISTAVAPFQPALTAAPNDYVVGIQYTGGGITGSYGTNGVAIDAAGNAWIDVGTTSAVHQVTEISPAGVFVSGTSGYGSTVLSGPQGIAIDASGNALVTDINVNKVYKFSGTNGSLLGTYTATSLNAPLGIAIDIDGSIWVANDNSSSVTHLTAAGVEATGSPYAAQLSGFDIAVNTTGVWSVDYGATGANGYVTDLLRGTGSTFTATSYQVTAHGQGLALDANGYAWYTTNGSSNTLGRANPTGGISFTPVAIPSPFQTLEVMVDGLNQVWVGTQNASALSTPGAVLRYSTAGTLTSPTTGFTANKTIVPSGDVPTGLAADGSGNLWVTGYVVDNSYTYQANAFVTELVGLAGPAVTPLVTAAKNGTLGTRPQ